MKKTLCVLLIIAIVMNFIVCNISYAEIDGTSSTVEEQMVSTPVNATNTIGAQIIEDGVVAQKQGQPANVHVTDEIGGQSIIGVILGSIALVLDAIPLQLQIILSAATITPMSDASGDGKVGFWITIERIVFNEISMFNANYFDNDNEYSVGTGENKLTITTSKANKSIKNSITTIYTVCRMVAIPISLLVLIYIGIRMAFSTVAEAEAKYKKMLIGWMESVVILFLLVYFMVGVFFFGDMLLNLFYNIKCQIISSGAQDFEETILWSFLDGIINASGITLAIYSLIYWVLVYTQLKFCYIYIKRLLTIGFLIMIAPLVTITYPIDKAGDGKAQALGNWFKEYIFNVLIQPLHALIYLIFMFSASEISAYAPLVALMFLLGLSTAENIIKKLLNVSATSIKGMKETFKKES